MFRRIWRAFYRFPREKNFFPVRLRAYLGRARHSVRADDRQRTARPTEIGSTSRRAQTIERIHGSDRNRDAGLRSIYHGRLRCRAPDSGCQAVGEFQYMAHRPGRPHDDDLISAIHHAQRRRWRKIPRKGKIADGLLRNHPAGCASETDHCCVAASDRRRQIDRIVRVVNLAGVLVHQMFGQEGAIIKQRGPNGISAAEIQR